jgi:hypothetical protein
MHRICVLTAVLFCTSTVTPVAAQRATFTGIVLDSVTAAPLSGVLVSVLGRSIVAVTDEAGRFELRGVPNGAVSIAARRLGYIAGRMDLEVSLAHDAAVDLGSVTLAPAVVLLDPVTIEESVRNERLEDVGFFDRMRTESGTFITHEDITKQNPSRTSDILRRVAGFRTLVSGDIASGRGVPTTSRWMSLCGVEYYIDGVHSEAPTIDVVIPSSILGIEVYSGSATIPPAFRISGNAKCGVIAIWTHDGRGMGARRRP